MKTKVLFLLHGDILGEELLAVFPDIEADYSGNKLCYAHIGQHGGCCDEYIKDSPEATPEEYEDLKEELISIGYDLEILNE